MNGQFWLLKKGKWPRIMKIWLDLPFLAFLVCQLGLVSIKVLFNCRLFSIIFL